MNDQQKRNFGRSLMETETDRSVNDWCYIVKVLYHGDINKIILDGRHGLKKAKEKNNIKLQENIRRSLDVLNHIKENYRWKLKP